MQPERQTRFSVVFSGTGGQGALTFGQYLAEAAVGEYKYVSLFPIYAPVMRGGDSESTVIASSEEIASPIVSKVDAAVTTGRLSFRQIEQRIRPGGIFFVDSSIILEKAQREDLRLFYIPAAKIASEKLGEPLTTNFVLMGAYLEVTKVLSFERIGELIEKKLKGTARAHMQELNIKALREGAKFVATPVA